MERILAESIVDTIRISSARALALSAAVDQIRERDRTIARQSRRIGQLRNEVRILRGEKPRHAAEPFGAAA